jgi:hypothetical protein
MGKRTKRPRGRPPRLQGTFITTTLSLAEPTYLRLRHLAVDRRVPMRDLIRLAVDEFLIAHAKGGKDR